MIRIDVFCSNFFLLQKLLIDNRAAGSATTATAATRASSTGEQLTGNSRYKNWGCVRFFIIVEPVLTDNFKLFANINLLVVGEAHG
jgi:hypothetical protein